MLERSIAENLLITRYSAISRGGFIREKAQRSTALAWIGALDVRTAGPDQPIDELSGGNQQKIALGRLLFHDARILLLDEPTRSLDPLAAARTRSLINSLARDAEKPVTVLLTSHNLAEIEELCNRVAVISRGSIRALDTPEHLRDLPRSAERVRLSVRGLLPEQARTALSQALDEFELSGDEETLVVQFTRTVNDDTLDRAVRVLQTASGRILACESERTTLLDVLEKYEREDETSEGEQR